MYDIRLLTLYKQHYLDAYKDPLACDYTCWGYFDGLDVRSVEAGPLFSTLWRANGKKVAEQKGNFSAQNIGLLRHLPDENARDAVNKFWDEHKCLPFFAVMLVQLDDADAYREAARLAEQAGSSQTGKPAQGPYCRTIAYGCFDNTDLVLLVHGNSLDKLQKALRRIEELEQVRYVHSIFAVSETYLRAIDNGAAPDRFQGNLCYVDERIPEVQINVVTDGRPETRDIVCAQLWKCLGEDICQNATVADKTGHESFAFSLYEIRTGDMLKLFLPEGFATHQNPCYGKEIYNISTSLLFDRQPLPQPPAESAESAESTEPTDPEHPMLWCESLIQDCGRKLKLAEDEKDESLCSYYQAMFQTLNTMSQYEQFALSENIFLALIPPMLMFHRQLSDALRSDAAKQRKGEFKESMCQFLEYANMVIYHTVHTDQIFLMVPGYSGTSFSIPIKLNLLFLWLSRKLTEVLNDSNHEYECILTPVMESTPATQLIAFDTEDQNRLIAIKVSQRLLYSPWELTVVLSHEIAHYVGRDLRCRAYRLEQLSQLLTYYVAERLLPREMLGDAGPSDLRCAYERWATLLSQSLQAYLEQHAEVFQTPELSYSHACVEQLSGACQSWLALQGNSANSLVLRVPKQLEEELLEDRGSYVRLMKALSHIQWEVQRNWVNLLAGNDCVNVTTEIFDISREVFSDMAALAVLGCTEEEFANTFSASEGVPVNASNRCARQWFRQDMANRVVFGGEGAGKEFNSPKSRALEALYKYRGTPDHFAAYAGRCYEALRARLEQEDVRKTREEIRTFYSAVAAGGDCVDIYAVVSGCISAYKKEVKALLQRKTQEYDLGGDAKN